ncbi:hypothetical protein PAE9249_01013 [Paenibacillus sp. CECT 9249]|uniref:hypothetical protein n=1 Tax=Paenibacillus sp. CECT 9249 TaxID=2845385 RepID=UPI001E57173E|nr:hypothetical protein [Paenibacillus sp. CECT 9249]CAH0118524.1 hypothetical protein PAE9249_01013 [Paenibacillus sp. CECT 9249]
MAFIADVFDVLLVDDSGEVFATTTLQTADIEVTVKENEWRGGKGNSLLAIIHSNRDIAVKLSDAEFRYDWIARQLGQNVVTGTGVGYAMPKWYKASGTTDVKITLDETPLADTLAIYKADGTLIPKTDYSAAGKEVKFSTDVKAGDQVEVRTYQFATPAQTQTIAIDNTVFAKGCKLILETLEIDSNEVPVYKIQYQFDQAMPSGNFSVKTASERNAQAQAFDLKILKPRESDVVGRVVRIPLS